MASQIIVSRIAFLSSLTVKNRVELQQESFTEIARHMGGGFTDRLHSVFIEAHQTGRTSTALETQGGTTMKSLKTIGIVTALALGLTTAVFAKPLELQTLDSAGANSTPTVTFATQGFSSTNKDLDATLDVYVPGWSLGVVGIDINGANLKISDVKAAKGITVTLKDASGGATKDRLRFEVCAAANTPKGTYPVQIMLENKKFGDQGMITIMAEVK
jgi:hypothetical protein